MSASDIFKAALNVNPPVAGQATEYDLAQAGYRRKFSVGDIVRVSTTEGAVRVLFGDDSVAASITIGDPIGAWDFRDYTIRNKGEAVCSVALDTGFGATGDVVVRKTGRVPECDL